MRALNGFIFSTLTLLAVAIPNSRLSPLHVEANRILDEKGQPVRLRGVNVASLEWSSDGEGHVLETARVAVQDWKANLIRLPLSQDRWFGKAPEQSDQGIAYRRLVRRVVDLCAANRCYVLLDLHWNDAGVWGQNIGQHVMPDMNSVEFWQSCAREYRNNPAVLFDLYNEPHDTTWDVWLRGGDVEEKSDAGARQGAFAPVKYRTPGMQAMLDAVRSTGAKNLVVAGGLDWAYDLSGFLNGYTLKDSKGRGVVYACHSYPFKGDTVDKWLSKLDRALSTIPVIISEFGDEPKGEARTKPSLWVEQVVREMGARGCNWTAWDLHPAAGPTLISDWNYTPTPYFGVIVKQALHR